MPWMSRIREALSPMGRVALLLAAVAMISAILPPMAEAARKAKPSFFKSVETQSKNLRPFKKWNGAMKRYSKQKAKEEKRTDCKAKRFNTCHYQVWLKFVDSIRDKPRSFQINKVNHWANQRRYVTDPRNWGQKDYWATPGEFIARFGDCEDYSIIKYLSLRALGFTDKEMRLVAVKDMNLKVGHAVLVVFDGGKTLLLDNQVKKVVETKKVRHYVPVFSINKSYWWRHRPG